MTRTPATDAFWAEFKRAAGVAHDDYVVVSFADNPEDADELAELVVAGTKRATASLLRDYDARNPVPRVGDLVVVVDSRGRPRCLWRTTWIRIGPLIEVDEAFAWDEGEGDRSRESWLDNHRRHFGGQAAREGFVMHDRIETVFERFAVVWPPELADPGAPSGQRAAGSL